MIVFKRFSRIRAFLSFGSKVVRSARFSAFKVLNFLTINLLDFFYQKFPAGNRKARARMAETSTPKNISKRIKCARRPIGIWAVAIAVICVCSCSVRAQSDSLATLFVESITVEGNRKTRASIILRELEFGIGDSLRAASLDAILERNRLRVMNLGVFSGAEIQVLRRDERDRLWLHIRVTEGWYIFPVPVFALADRNFNVWWKEFDRSLKRVNYGIDWTQLNLTGRADALKAKAQFGYTNRYEIAYRGPSINPRQTLGADLNVSYSRAHELAYRTVGNKLAFRVVPDEWQITQFAAAATLTARPKLFATHSFTAEYRHNRIADSIAMLNPDFFLRGDVQQRHLSVIYGLTLDYRDIRPYPLKGWRAIVEVRQNGLLPQDNLKIFRAFAQLDQYFTLSKHLSFEAILKGRTSLPRRQPPYYNNAALGYGGNFVRGYEYYVADGLDFGLLRTSLHWEVFSRSFDLGRYMPLKAYRIFPLKIYLAFNNDTGYANDPYYATDNPVANRWLYGYGLGLDVVAYYDKTMRLEWSWNDLGERGFFLRINTGF
jgi:hypothetical protein